MIRNGLEAESDPAQIDILPFLPGKAQPDECANRSACQDAHSCQEKGQSCQVPLPRFGSVDQNWNREDGSETHSCDESGRYCLALATGPDALLQPGDAGQRNIYLPRGGGLAHGEGAVRELFQSARDLPAVSLALILLGEVRRPDAGAGLKPLKYFSRR